MGADRHATANLQQIQLLLENLGEQAAGTASALPSATVQPAHQTDAAPAADGGPDPDPASAPAALEAE
ncbi:hypothetical protein [Deinococcus aquaticus]|uniref:hypothetical protein n=1 Tax=Deinococcus aquaticus TaxID=328692 RepID=UPI003F4583A5